MELEEQTETETSYNNFVSTVTSDFSKIATLDDVIVFLQSMNKQTLHSEVLKVENERLKVELIETRNELNKIKRIILLVS